MSAMPHARLVPLAAPANLAPQSVTLEAKRTTFGRASDNTVTLVDREVSKHHAEVMWDGTLFILRDLESSNGTFVNGKRIYEHVLRAGDVLRLGSSEYELELGQSLKAVTVAPPGRGDHTQILMASPVDDLDDEASIVPDDLAGRYERVRSAFSALRELVEIQDIQELCARILDVTFELLQAETGAVLLFDAGHELVPWATRNDGFGDGQIVISQTIVDQVIAEKSALVAHDALRDARWSSSESVVASGIRSLLCVPLLHRDQIFGILHIGNASAAGLFGKTDLELISGIAQGAGVALANAFMVHRLREESKRRESLGRFLSPHLVERVMSQELQLARGGDLREVSVMFADIRSFTSLTERTPAEDVVYLLNEYFDRMVEVVFEHGGILDKFIGDALMAIWGVPVAGASDAKDALGCAEQMMVALERLNEVRVARGDAPIEVGVGIASGTCVAGAIGARRRMDYTVIGDAVNVAARLAAMAEPSEVLCDGVTYRSAGKPRGAKSKGSLQVKGRDAAVEVWSEALG